MWTDDEPFLKSVPREKFLQMNCINFMPEIPIGTGPKKYDLCIVAHATSIKRIYELLQIVRNLMNLRPTLSVVFVVPDQRNIKNGEDTYQKDDIDRRYYELPQTLFSANELKQISFVSSSTQAFGKFPLAAELVWDFMRSSRLLLSFSYQEGTPRIFPEAFMCGTPCAINEKTQFGLRSAHNDQNTLWLKDDVGIAAQQINDALENYQRFNIDREAILDDFSEKRNFGKLKSFLTQAIHSRDLAVEGEWYFDELHLRLPCHGKKINHQYMYNEQLFFTWLERIQKFNPYDEDAVLGLPPLNDQRTWLTNLAEFKLKAERKLRRVVKPAESR